MVKNNPFNYFADERQVRYGPVVVIYRGIQIPFFNKGFWKIRGFGKIPDFGDVFTSFSTSVIRRWKTDKQLSCRNIQIAG